MSSPGNGNGPAVVRPAVVRQVGPLTVAFESDDVAVRDRFDGLYGAFARLDDPAGASTTVVSIERTAETEHEPVWTASVDGALCRRSPHLALIEESVTRRINRLVLDAETDRLHLHAGAVACEEAVVLVIGTSGSGKSTLVTRLVADGWSYLSDEQLGVLEGGRLVPYPRPMTLRRASWALLPGLVPDGLADVIERYEVAPSNVGVVPHREPVAPKLIVTPDLGQAKTEVEVLSAASALRALLEDTLDLERAGRAGFDRLLELATAAPMVRIGGTALDRTVAAIEDEVGALRAAPTIVAMVEPAAGSCVVSSARAWHFSDDTAVIYDEDTGSLAELDGAGFAAWSVLANQPADELPAEAARSAFAHELRDAGLLRKDGP